MQEIMPDKAAERRVRQARQARERRARNPQPHRDKDRRWREANPDKVAAYREQRKAARTATEIQRDREANRERMRRWRSANRAAYNARTSEWQRRRRHGSDVAAVSAAMWQEQGGKCYLCGIYLVPEVAFIDHDHRCCPRNRSCFRCRRGLACDFCNALIGLAHDDPDTLRLIADNLEAKLAEINERFDGAR